MLGLSLPIIGGLLGHSQPGTTARYAHLLDDPLRVATEWAAAVIMGASLAGGEDCPAEAGMSRPSSPFNGLGAGTPREPVGANAKPAVCMGRYSGV